MRRTPRRNIRKTYDRLSSLSALKGGRRIRIADSLRGCRTARSAFTLIELLVAMTIFIILAALAIGAFKGVSKDDRISAGAQQVRGWFEHARSRAIHDKQPRGIRFLPDQNNPRLCTSVAYIGGAGYDDGDLTALPLTERKYMWVFQAPFAYQGQGWAAGTVLMPGGVPMSATPAMTTGTPTGNPGNAGALGLLGLVTNGSITDTTATVHGLRIEIPRGSGMWYPIRWVSEDRDGSQTLNGTEDVNANGVLDPILFLAKPIQNFAQYAGQPLDYRLEIGPTVLTDPDNHPLTRGVVIDLDASFIPAAWRPTSFGGPYPGQMDIMFSPRGGFTGQIATASGVMHFCVSTLEDAERARANDTPATGNIHPANITASTTLPAGPPTFVPYPYILADPATSQRLVSVNMNSGRVSTSAVFIPNTGDPYSDGAQNTRAGTSTSFADTVSCSLYAARGKEAK